MSYKFAIFVSFVIHFTSAVDLNCVFDIVKNTENIRGLESYIEKNYRYENFFEKFKLYRCTSKNLTITTRDEIIDNVTGDHLTDYTNREVKWLTIKESVVNFMPRGFKNFFPTIRVLIINGIQLLELTTENMNEFPGLRFIWAANNELVTLSSDLFKSIYPIFVIDFSNNKLKHLDKKALVRRGTDYADFSNNECIDRDMDYVADYPFASVNHATCLFPYEIYCEYESINDITYAVAIRDGVEYDGIEKTTIRCTQHRICEVLKVNRVVRKVSITFSNFTKIPRVVCEEFENLDELEITGSLIEKISRDELKHFHRLKILKLPYNRIGSVKSDTFIFNKKLKSIDLSYNKIRTIGLSAFIVLKNLQSLSLRSLPCIDGAGSINDSNLESFIHQVQEKCPLDDVIKCKFSTSYFRYIGSAYYCDIVRRKVEDIEHKFFPELINENFSKLSRLEKFYGIIGEHLSGMSNLDVGVLSVKNDLSRIVDKNLNLYFPSLKIFRITHSQLRYLFEETFNGLTNLTVVDMSHNFLTEIPKNIFEQNQNLIVVDFSFNNLKRVSVVVFEKLVNIAMIKLIGNPCISVKSKNIDPKILDSALSNCNSYGIELFCKKEYVKICLVETIEQISNIHSVVKVHSIQNLSEVTDFTIDYAAIENLPTNISNFFPSITQYAAYGIIKKIVKENFEKLKTLEIIDLSFNRIEYIEKDSFIDNNRLYRVFLNFNRIKSLSENTFKNLWGLETLEMKGNICVNAYFQKIPSGGSDRRLEIIKNICGTTLSLGYKKVAKSVMYYYS